MPRSRVILLMGLAPLALSGMAMAQSRPADAQPAASTASTIRPAWNVPINFARSGRKSTAEVMMVTFPFKEVVLRAYGRTWSSPVPLRAERGVGNWRAEFDVPSVRVPTVFAISPAKPVEGPQTVLGELVAYPDRDAPWDKKRVLVSDGAPLWFEQWARAVGLPLQSSDGNGAATLPALRPEERCLLVLGRQPARKGYWEFLTEQRRPGANALILDAPWMGSEKTPLEIAPVHMQGPLASLRTQKWSRPLAFSDFHAANRILCNRWSLADRGPVPPLEVVGDLQTGPWAALSGIPWQEQLGRREEADELLLEVLKAVAAFAPKVETRRQGTMVYPEKVAYDPKTMACCPALACMTHGEKAAGTPRVLIVDLRGPGPVPAELLERWKTHANGMDKEDRLLVVGDDPILDRWEWLRLDRAKKALHRPGVAWLDDDQAWDKTYEIPLMLKLTELGVPLAPPGEEEKKK